MPELMKQEENAKYSDAIKALVPINELAPQLQGQLISKANILQYRKKEFVFKEGDIDDYAFYLLEGQIDLLSKNSVQSTIVSGTDSARYAMARLQPRQFSARAKTDITILELERITLDRLMVMDQQTKSQGEPGAEVEVSNIEEEQSGDWMTRVLQSELFSRLPTANIQKLFALLEAVEYKAGDTVINQGDSGDFYFIVQEGRCEVVRAPTHGAKLIRLAELHTGDSFGEEALLTNTTRNASIRMLTDGVLMRLSKDNFINLIKKPVLGEVSYAEAKKLVDEGKAAWLDVRYQNEFDESKQEGSLHIPLTILRMQTGRLDREKRYIICCDTGGRSSAATFLLTNLGFNVCYLKGGLSSVPQDALEKKQPQPPAAEVIAAPPPTPAKEPEKEIKPATLEPGVRSSVIEASLAVTSMELEEAKKKQAVQESAETKEMQKRLETEKKRLEAEKKASEEEDRKLREREQEKIKRLQEESEKRMEAERKRLEDVYTRNTRDMEKLQRLKEEAEAQIRKERGKLERETAEAQRKLNEAKRSLEEQAARKRAEQEALERNLQAKAKASLEDNRRKLAEEIARSNEELERARKEKDMADAARLAAQEEAKRIIAEYKHNLDQERDQERAKLQEERSKLEAESRKIQATMQTIHKSREEAEAVRASAQAEMQSLRVKQKESNGQDAEIQRIVAEQIQVVEARMRQAQQNLDDAQKAQVKATTAKVLNVQELQKSKEEEDKVRKQIE
ncbi:MAG: cyclic nucleotide-binding domain-containing protein, partial [Gammaproteobacteria bacterium]